MDRVSRLSADVSCPRCGEVTGQSELEAFRGWTVCHRRRCGQRWWTMLFNVGPVVPQLEEVFGRDLSLELMAAFEMPQFVSRVTYWQLSVSRSVYQRHGAAGSDALVRAVVALVRAHTAAIDLIASETPDTP